MCHLVHGFINNELHLKTVWSHEYFSPANQTRFPNCNITHYDDLGDVETGKRKLK